MKLRLEGRTVIVIGAGSIGQGWGNGKASALAYARQGAQVACVDHSLERAEQTVGVIVSEGGQAVACEADATREEDVASAIERTLSHFGRLDVLHNNVGVGGTTGTPDEIAPADWDREIAQNLTTAYLGTRCAVPIMREQGGGVITNISSTMAVRFLRRPSVGYTAAKSAVEAMTRACAVAYGPDNIRVNCIRIGIAETPLITMALEMRGLSESRREEEMSKSRSKVPLRGEHTNPFDVALAAVFLASDEASHVTGTILNVDGGLESAPL